MNIMYREPHNKTNMVKRRFKAKHAGSFSHFLYQLFSSLCPHDVPGQHFPLPFSKEMESGLLLLPGLVWLAGRLLKTPKLKKKPATLTSLGQQQDPLCPPFPEVVERLLNASQMCFLATCEHRVRTTTPLTINKIPLFIYPVHVGSSPVVDDVFIPCRRHRWRDLDHDYQAKHKKVPEQNFHEV